MNAFAPLDFGGAQDGAAEQFRPGRLWSLWDMYQILAHHYLEIGGEVVRLERLIEFTKAEITDESNVSKEDAPLLSFKRRETEDVISKLGRMCEEINLPISSKLLKKASGDLPKSSRELNILLSAIMSELESQLFLFVPQHRAKYYEIMFQSFISTKFPTATKELVASGNALAAGLYTASVFHSMRAAEIGMRALGAELKVSFPNKPIELADWHNILDQADSKITAMKNLPAGLTKDAELKFFSQAAVQFRYFKDGWRVRVAHARETYEEIPATRVFGHTWEFFEVLSTRLSETLPDDFF